MGNYTSYATTKLAAIDCAIRYKLELRTNFTGATWLEYDYEPGSLNMNWPEDSPAELRVSLINTGLDFNTQGDSITRTNLGGEVRVTSYVGDDSDAGQESRVEFTGEILEVFATNGDFGIRAACELYRLSKALGAIDNRIGPAEVVVTGSTRRALTHLGDQYGEVYVLTPNGSGTDPAFDAATQLQRRSWSDQGIRIWKHATLTTYVDGQGFTQTYEVPNTLWRADYFSGAVTILENEPADTYYISNVGAYEETQLGAESTTGGKNADFARIFEGLILYPKHGRGMGVERGGEWGNTVTAVSTGSQTFTIAGDHRHRYKDGSQIYLYGGANQGTYTVNGTPALSGTDTVITVDQAVPSSTVAGTISLDVAIDMPGLFNFELGKITDVLQEMRQKFQRNIKPVYDYDRGKFYLQVIVQQEAGSEDWVCSTAASIDQPRSSTDMFTAIQVTGKKARPINSVQYADSIGELTDISTAGDWTLWNGADVKGSDTFANLKEYIWDSNATLGLLLHNLNGTADIDAGADQYTGWYKMFQWSIDPLKSLKKIEIIASGSRNPKHQQGHQGIFWPGYRLEISNDDGVTWYPVTPLIAGRFSPGSTISVEGNQMARRFGTHLRLLGGAYKEGFSNQDDPAVGVFEVRAYQDTDYSIIVGMSTMHPIVARTTGAGGTLSIEGDYREEFHDGDTFTVRSNGGTGDGNYTIASSGVAYSSITGQTTLTVTGTIPPGTAADGELYSTTDYTISNSETVKRDYPDVWDRFNGEIKTYVESLGDQYDEFRARDFAIILFDEFMRLFGGATHQTVKPDPRPQQWQTVSFVDEFNGDVGTLLVREITKTDELTEITGTNYKAGVIAA